MGVSQGVQQNLPGETAAVLLKRHKQLLMAGVAAIPLVPNFQNLNSIADAAPAALRTTQTKQSSTKQR
jgi:hypothetical protein